jgi:hypothetical protein
MSVSSTSLPFSIEPKAIAAAKALYERSSLCGLHALSVFIFRSVIEF